MVDLISKQAAIEALRNLPRWIMDPNGEFQPVDPPTVSMIDPDDAVSAIENLPSELEIIACKDCKHRGEKPIADGRYWCEIHDTFMYYCSDAERSDGNE